MSLSPYLVLARKYRPTSFADLRGQEALATTISNAIEVDRVAHAFLFTGIRGVGKTTSARILAKTLNCTNKQSGEFITPCGTCANCVAMQNDNHPDMIEIDAASKTGVNDAREIIENARYLPILGQYKIFIIDEVHMLSTNAFNAFLKILEEPPLHVKFIFATTEIRKVPVTIISRCQRFDLRRLTSAEIISHLTEILIKENIKVEDEVLTIIAENSEGSVRDSLSLLDQAISYMPKADVITAQVIRQMLGLCDNNELIQLLELITIGQAKEALHQADKLYMQGAEPLQIIDELMKLIHLISKLKLCPESLKLASFGILAEERIQALTAKLSLASLTVLWQLLTKAVDEIKKSNQTFLCLEMMIIRLCYQANLPNPNELMSRTQTSAIVVEPKIVVNPAKPLPDISTDIVKPGDYKQLVQLFYNRQEIVLHHYLCDEVEVVSFAPGQLLIRPNAHLPKNFLNQVSNLLQEWTGDRWQVKINEKDSADASLKQQDEIAYSQLKQQVAETDGVKEILHAFQGAEINKIVKV